MLGGDLMNFKNIFLSLRTGKGFSQEQISRELNVSKSTVAMWETGKRLPSPELFELIADYFNVDIDFLYGRTDIKRKILFDEYGDEFVRTDLGILLHYNRLNTIGKNEATKRVEELTHIPIYTEPEHLMVDAAHERTDIEITDEMRKHDDDIMNDENF